MVHPTYGTTQVSFASSRWKWPCILYSSLLIIGQFIVSLLYSLFIETLLLRSLMFAFYVMNSITIYSLLLWSGIAFIKFLKSETSCSPLLINRVCEYLLKKVNILIDCEIFVRNWDGKYLLDFIINCESIAGLPNLNHSI